MLYPPPRYRFSKIGVYAVLRLWLLFFGGALAIPPEAVEDGADIHAFAIDERSLTARGGGGAVAAEGLRQILEADDRAGRDGARVFDGVL